MPRLSSSFGVPHLTQIPFAILHSYSCLALTLALNRWKTHKCLPGVDFRLHSRHRPFLLCLCRRLRALCLACSRISYSLVLSFSRFSQRKNDAAAVDRCLMYGPPFWGCWLVRSEAVLPLCGAEAILRFGSPDARLRVSQTADLASRAAPARK